VNSTIGSFTYWNALNASFSHSFSGLVKTSSCGHKSLFLGLFENKNIWKLLHSCIELALLHHLPSYSLNTTASSSPKYSLTTPPCPELAG
jgi:hypothetical protein